MLVVDDQEDARDLMTSILSSVGAHADTAASVPDALHKMALKRPHVLLADIGMPGADGYALIHEVRRQDARIGARLPAAAVTAYVGDADREKVLAAGSDCHVPKPVTQSALVDAVLAICADPIEPS